MMVDTSSGWIRPTRPSFSPELTSRRPHPTAERPLISWHTGEGGRDVKVQRIGPDRSLIDRSGFASPTPHLPQLSLIQSSSRPTRVGTGVGLYFLGRAFGGGFSSRVQHRVQLARVGYSGVRFKFGFHLGLSRLGFYVRVIKVRGFR